MKKTRRRWELKTPSPNLQSFYTKDSHKVAWSLAT